MTGVRLPAETRARIESVLADGERLSDLIRTAIEAELARRERG